MFSGRLWRVDIRVQGLAITHQWTGYADDAADASRRATGDARNRWQGQFFTVLSVLQVTA